MLRFWKKKNDDEDEDDEVEESKPKRVRKKKEPLKPWGKRERIIVLSAILITLIASGIASVRSEDFSFSTTPLKFLGLQSFNPFREETIVLYGTQGEEKDPSELVNSIIGKISHLKGDYAFVVVRLGSGYRYGLNNKEIMPAASLIKLPVMAAMYKADEDGYIDLDQKYTLRPTDKVEGSGSLATQPDGFKISYHELIKLMGKESDNTAFNISRTLAGRSTINNILDEAGMKNTSIVSNNTTADDIAIFFEGLWSYDLINNDNKGQLLDHLTDTIYEDWISRGVPENIRVTHKYGVLDEVVNDAGIVFSDDPYVLVILSSGVSREEANIVIPELSRMVFEFETSE